MAENDPFASIYDTADSETEVLGDETLSVRQERGRGRMPAASVERETQEDDPFTSIYEDQGDSQLERLSEGVQTGVGATIEAIPATAGALGGAKIGATLGSFFGPGGTIVGGGLGTLTGLLLSGGAGRELREYLAERGIGSTEVETPEQRFFESFGFTLGSAFTLQGVARSSFRYGDSRVGKFVNEILDSIKKNPGTSAAAEAISGASAASAAAYASTQTEDELNIALAEIAGGVAAPGRWWLISTKYALDHLKSLSGVLPGAAGSAGVENRTAKVLQDLLERYRENPETLLQALRDTDLVGPVAAKADSPALAILQNTLREMNIKGRTEFGLEIDKQTQAGFDSMLIVVDRLRQLGDPASLKAASDLQQKVFGEMLDRQLEVARKEARLTAARLGDTSGATRSEVSQKTTQIASRALELAREQESRLWSLVDGSVDMNDYVDNMAESIIQMKVRHTAWEEGVKLDPVVEKFLSNIKKRQDLLDAGEDIPDVLNFNADRFKRLRSHLLSLARSEAAEGGNAELSKVYFTLADDMSELMNMAYAGDPAYDLARGFSRELNDTYTRTFVGTITAKTRSGELKTPPELALRQGLATGMEASNLKFNQLQEATRFLENRLVGASQREAADLTIEMVSAQTHFLRLLATESIVDGVANPDKLKTFLRQHKELFNNPVFSEIKKQIQAAARSQKKAEEFVANIKELKLKKQQQKFAAFSGTEDASLVVGRAINGDTPKADLQSLARVARRSADTKQGMASAVLFAARDKAVRANGTLDVVAFRKYLFDPIGDQKQSVAEILFSEGIFDSDTMNELRKMIEQAAQLTAAKNQGRRLTEQEIQEQNLFMNGLSRITGATLAGVVPEAMGVPTTSAAALVRGNIGASTGQRVFEQLPMSKVQNLLMAALLDKELMSRLLATSPDPAEQVRAVRNAYVYAITAGYLALDEDINLPEGEDLQSQAGQLGLGRGRMPEGMSEPALMEE